MSKQDERRRCPWPSLAGAPIVWRTDYHVDGAPLPYTRPALTRRCERLGWRIAVVGSREFMNPERVREHVYAFVAGLRQIDTIVSGGAKGVDSWAVEAAHLYDLYTDVYLPDWKQYGKSAGMIRNAEIVANSNFVVAFWDGQSKGTRNTIERALKVDMPVLVFEFGQAARKSQRLFEALPRRGVA